MTNEHHDEKLGERDHRKLGRELDLFTFSDLVGAGLPLWMPKGTLIRNLLDDFVWELRKKRGYEQVDIPHLTKKELYEKSGHWDKFSDELFKITSREGHEFAVKPMNCPHHTQIYDARPRSYREMPIRYANTTKVYRDEQSGELGGLTRVRSITIDDAHVFCRREQVKEEFSIVWDIIEEFYGAFSFLLTPRLSLHDPDNMEKYLGEPTTWDEMAELLREVANERGVELKEEAGEAAFYGPKIDFVAVDSIGREWQIATIQIDMNLPERFDLTVVNEKGENERIIMIHAAVMGSLERFMAILIEHYAGAFPLWLSPIQVAILPIGESHHGYAEEIAKKLKDSGIRAELHAGNETLGKRIRTVKTEKTPYFLVLGDEEVADRSVTLESRDENTSKQKLSVEELIHRLHTETHERRA